MREYLVTLTGTTDMIQHADNIEWADQMEAWRRNPKNKGASKAGDDRTPPYRWLGNLYHDGTRVTVPTENIMRSFMSGGALIPTGKGQKTFKSQTQSGMIAPDFHWPLEPDIPVAELFAAGFEARTWEEWNTLVEQLGFSLFLKRAAIGGKKHVRVRPKFKQWQVSGVITVLDEAITLDILNQIIELSGRYAGLCDWRPGSKTPGPYGMYTGSARLRTTRRG